MDRGVLAVKTLHFLITVINYFLTVSAANAEVDALNALKNSLTTPTTALDSWDSAADTPCTWFHVTCNNDQRVTRIDLGTANLSGKIVPDVGQLIYLEYLELYENNISGEIPNEVGNLVNLVSLDLYQNNITGPIPAALSNLSKLQFLRLNNNNLKGEIPVSLVTISNLQILDFSFNQLVGDIPVNGSFSHFTPVSFRGNPHLKNVSEASPPVYYPPPSSSPAIHNTGAIVGGVAVAAAVLFTGPAIAIAWWLRRKPRDHYFDVPAEEVTKVHLGLLKRFPLRELQIATDNFSPKNILGRGGFGKVYKGRLPDGSLVAVKRLKQERSQGGELQFQTEVELISMAVHSNLLPLQGFCMTPTERLLVYPFMVNGSVASRLREHPETQPLSWETRKQIALGAARGLAYLHEECATKIIHRDVKAANVLLDSNFKAVIGDFGLAKLMDYRDTHVTTAVRGTIGHIAPEYLSTGKSSEKTDVFGFGIMLLELITGQRAFDLARMANDEEVMLLDWVKGHLDENKLDMLVDVNLQGNYDEREVEELFQIALLCTNGAPMDRPKMSEVVHMLEGDGLAERWWKWQNDKITQPQIYRSNPFQPPFTLNDSTPNLCPDQLSGPR